MLFPGKCPQLEDGDEACLTVPYPPPPAAPAAASASANGRAVTGRGSLRAGALPASGQPPGDLSTLDSEHFRPAPRTAPHVSGTVRSPNRLVRPWEAGNGDV
jgi:hypothetical protein